MRYYNFDDSIQRERFNKNKHIPVPPAAMRKYFEWRNRVDNYGHHPKTAAESICDAHFEYLGGGVFSFRLTQEHRVVFFKRGNDISVLSVGGHYVRQ